MLCHDAIRYFAKEKPTERGLTPEELIEYFQNKSLLLIIGGSSTGQEINAIDLETKQCTFIKDMPYDHHHGCATEHRGKVYCFGGYRYANQAYVIEVQQLLDTNYLTVMPSTQVDGGAAFLNGLIYVCGGITTIDPDAADIVKDTCDAYSISRQEWYSMPPLNVGVSSHATVTFDGCVFVIGGWNQLDKLSCVQRYDPFMQKWFDEKPMMTIRNHLTAVVLDNAIYAIGGFCRCPLNVVEKYVDGKWILCSGMNRARWAHAACAVDNQIYVIGGYGVPGTSQSVEVYDPSADRWSMFCETEKEYTRHSAFPFRV